MRNPRAVARQERIVRLLARRPETSVAELCELLGVSGWTVRRDLDALEAQGLLARRRGGAELVGSGSARSADEHDLRLEAKRRIGRAAARLLRAGQRVAIGAGSTTLQVALALAGRRELAVVTNALDIALALAPEPGITVTCTGGDVHPDYSTLTGPVAERAVRALDFDVAVIGVSGLDARAGMTSASALNAGPLALMAEAAHALVVVADQSKFGSVCLAPLGTLAQIDVLVTDAPPPPELREALAAARADVVVADGPTSS